MDLLFFELDCFDVTGLSAPDVMTCVSLVGENWSRILSRESFNGAFVGRLFVFWITIGKEGNRGTWCLYILLLVFVLLLLLLLFPVPLAIGRFELHQCGWAI